MSILCITPNPSVDRTLSVGGFRSGGVWRASAVRVTCGGKGVNVSRALGHLGVSSRNGGILSGRSGRSAAEHAQIEGLDARWTWIDGGGETRTCVHIVSDDGQTTVINEPGTRVSSGDWDRLIADTRRLADGTAAVAISGSLPPGCPDSGLARLIAAAAGGCGRPIWVDTSGRALSQAAAAAPYGIKINAEEAAGLLSREIRSADDALDAAAAVRRRGPACVAVTLGAEGAAMATETGAWYARPPRVKTVNAVGSGDCFLAGLLAAHASGVGPADTLRLATASGAANAAAMGMSDWTEDAVHHLASRTTVNTIGA